MKQSDLIRFWQKIKFDRSGCWLWQAKLSHNDYGEFWLDGRTQRAARVSFKWFNGPLADIDVPDHLCKIHPCVNPNHLEACTHIENVMRGDGPPAQNARKTHCQHGHLLSGDNLRIRTSGSRECRTCNRMMQSWRRYGIRPSWM